ncbi:MAG: hypothetical protein LBE76_00465 [Nitrososphaerota archaeon]|jgi:hypothetical protein|nr:hypothetical protein [Nitrososphaerota archaeon]
MGKIIGGRFCCKGYAVNIADVMSGCHVYQAVKDKYLSIRGGCGGEGYRGIFVGFVWVKYGEVVGIVVKIKSKRWQVLPWRWCVEWIFVWAIWSGYFVKELRN